MYKLITLLMTLLIGLSFANLAQARDTRYLLPIAPAMNSNPVQERLDGTVKFYFGNQAHPAILKDFGSATTNPKSSAFLKSYTRSCNRAFLSALISLQNHAKKVGANAVVNVVSYYKKNEFSSADQFECHEGGLIAGVALKGDFVKVASK